MTCLLLQPREDAPVDTGCFSARSSTTQLGRLGEEQNQLCFPLKGMSAHQWRRDCTASHNFFESHLPAGSLPWQEWSCKVHWLNPRLMSWGLNGVNFGVRLCIDMNQTVILVCSFQLRIFCDSTTDHRRFWSLQFLCLLPPSRLPPGQLTKLCDHRFLWLPMWAEWLCSLWPRHLQKVFTSTPSSQALKLRRHEKRGLGLQ